MCSLVSGWEDLPEKEWKPTPVCLPRKSHGWRDLAGYSPWGCKELDTTEQLHSLTVSLSIMFSRLIHVVTYVNPSLICVANIPL